MELAVIEKTLRPSYYKAQMNKKSKYIALGPMAYYQLTYYLDDDYLSEWELFKLKTCNRYYGIQSMIVPIVTAGIAYYAFPKMFGLIDANRSHFKYMKFGFALAFGGTIYSEINMYPWPNKHLHEIITQPEPRGRFIRQTLKDVHPRKWSLMSKELNELGYNFREMNEYSRKEVMPSITTKHDDSIL